MRPPTKLDATDLDVNDRLVALALSEGECNTATLQARRPYDNPGRVVTHANRLVAAGLARRVRIPKGSCRYALTPEGFVWCARERGQVAPDGEGLNATHEAEDANA